MLTTTKTPIKPLSREKSTELNIHLRNVMPGGVGSPARSFNSVREEPLVISRGAGDTIYDVDGNAFIDYHMSWGALVHGHAHPTISKALQQRIEDGTSFGLNCTIEEPLAHKIIQHIPSIEQVRFVNSGSEATMTAARVARGYTGRDYIIKFTGNFHGHADLFLVKGGSAMLGSTPTATSAGVPQDVIKHTVCLPYNDIEATREVLCSPNYRDKIAAVIVEPIAANMGVVPATKAFLSMLREETTKIGALLIFDEVVSGFRVGLGGAQALYGIRPDLTTLGKIVGGGTPAAALGGSRKILEVLAPLGPVYHSGTLNGNPLSMEAGYQTLKLLETKGTFDELERKTRLLIEPIQERFSAKDAPACVQRVGSMFTLFFGKKVVNNMEEAAQLDLELFQRFFSHVFANGVLLAPAQYEASFVSTSHTDEHLAYTRDVILDFIDQTF